MRSLFIIGLKLLGVVFLYLTFGNIGQIGVAISSMRTWNASGISAYWYFTSIGIAYFIQFLFAVLLLFRAEAIAAVFHVGEAEGEGRQISTASLLYVVLVGIGVYVLLESIPRLVKDILHLVQGPLGVTAYQIADLIGSSLQILLALLVLQRAGAMARTILKRKS